MEEFFAKRTFVTKGEITGHDNIVTRGGLESDRGLAKHGKETLQRYCDKFDTNGKLKTEYVDPESVALGGLTPGILSLLKTHCAGRYPVPVKQGPLTRKPVACTSETVIPGLGPDVAVELWASGVPGTEAERLCSGTSTSSSSVYVGNGPVAPGGGPFGLVLPSSGLGAKCDANWIRDEPMARNCGGFCCGGGHLPPRKKYGVIIALDQVHHCELGNGETARVAPDGFHGSRSAARMLFKWNPETRCRQLSSLNPPTITGGFHFPRPSGPAPKGVRVSSDGVLIVGPEAGTPGGGALLLQGLFNAGGSVRRVDLPLTNGKGLLNMVRTHRPKTKAGERVHQGVVNAVLDVPVRVTSLYLTPGSDVYLKRMVTLVEVQKGVFWSPANLDNDPSMGKYTILGNIKRKGDEEKSYSPGLPNGVYFDPVAKVRFLISTDGAGGATVVEKTWTGVNEDLE